MDNKQYFASITVETIGRARLEKGLNGSLCILIKNKLEDDFDVTPRPVKHVGEQKYIMGIWNKIRKNRSKYENDPKMFP